MSRQLPGSALAASAKLGMVSLRLLSPKSLWPFGSPGVLSLKVPGTYPVSAGQKNYVFWTILALTDFCEHNGSMLSCKFIPIEYIFTVIYDLGSLLSSGDNWKVRTDPASLKLSKDDYSVESQ